ncbi:MAG: hypothetical protein WBA77_08200 [Microcoleaceae cyanobacterium]
MAAPSPNPYKSRIFNTVSQQYRQFLDGCDTATARLRQRTFRQVRLTTSYATQILLYPIYVLIQGAKRVGKQLKAQTNIGIPQLNDSPHSTDITVEDILPTLTSPVQVQGIASRLDTQQLVLVAANTQTLHPLTASQQQTLQQQIKNTLQKNSKKTSYFPALQPAIPAMGLILPVYCMLSQAMGWVQTSPVAMGLNLFGESALAKVEPISPDNTSVVSSTEFSQNSTISDLDSQSQSKIQGLIQAAIRYFYNPDDLNSVDEQYYPVLDASENLSAIAGNEKQVSILPQSQNQTAQLSLGIWQRMQHSSFPLFAGIGVGGFLIAATVGQYIFEDEAIASKVKLTDSQTPIQPPSNPQTEWNSPLGLTSVENYGKKSIIEIDKQLEGARLQPAYSEGSPEILETPVTAVEYVKHPLEKLLEWLDGAMYWVEESFLKLRNWMVSRIK